MPRPEATKKISSFSKPLKRLQSPAKAAASIVDSPSRDTKDKAGGALQKLSHAEMVTLMADAKWTSI